LLTRRGLAPIDLTLYALDNALLPEIQWGGDGGVLSKTDADFVARCYLLQYYRAE
jgi:hypothetical protein